MIIIFFFLDYDQQGNLIKWHPDKQGKRKKKSEGLTNVDPARDGTGKIHSQHLLHIG